MKLWLISQDVNTGYDTFDSAVVAAYDEDAARKTYPNRTREWSESEGSWMFIYADGERQKNIPDAWAHPDSVQAKEIGRAIDGTAAGVILASFNAG